METLNISKDNALKAFNEGCSDVKKVLNNLFGPETFRPKNIMDQVKTYEDACKLLGIDPQERLPFEDPGSKDDAAINAYAKIFIISKALNEEWTPDWKNSSQPKYYPWFDMQAGSGFSYDGCVNSRSGSCVGSRLCFKSRELAEYAGKQFLSIYKDAFTL
jgi:hypothetical protein